MENAVSTRGSYLPGKVNGGWHGGKGKSNRIESVQGEGSGAERLQVELRRKLPTISRIP